MFTVYNSALWVQLKSTVFFLLFKMFELVSAELSLETVQLLTRGQTKTPLDEIAGKTGIKWIEVSETFTMSGDFKQVERSRTYLQQAINQSGWFIKHLYHHVVFTDCERQDKIFVIAG